MLKAFDDVVTAISSAGPLNVANKLFSADLISQETLSKILTVPATPLEKSTTLVLSVLDQVNVNSEKLKSFIEVLSTCIDEASFQSKLV